MFIKKTHTRIEQKIYYVFFFLVLIFGIYLRLLNYSSSPFWHDEAWRAILMSDFKELRIHEFQASHSSIGYLLLGNILAKISNTEAVLRLTSLIPSVLVMIFIYLVCAKITRNKILCLLSMFITAINTELIFYAKELKPYSLELLLHLSLFYLLLIFLEKKDDFSLKLIVIFSVISYFCATNTIFLLPSIFILILVYRRHDKYSLIFIGITILFFISQILIFYNRFYSNVGNYNMLQSWTKNILIEEKGLWQYLLWLLNHYKDMIYYIVFLKFNIFKILVLLGIYATGIAFIFQNRKFEYFLLYIFPVFIMMIFNYLKKWPFGYVRVNIFLYGSFLFILILGLDYMIRKIKLKQVVYVILIATLSFELILNFREITTNIVTADDDVPKCIEYLYKNIKNNLNQQKEIICINELARIPFKYYTTYHRKLNVKFGAFFEQHTKLLGFSGLVPQDGKRYKELKNYSYFFADRNIWIVHTEANDETRSIFRSFIENNFYILSERNFNIGSVFYCRSKIWKK